MLVGMYSGIYTPTEGAGIAVAYAMLVSIYVYKRLKWSDIPRIIAKNARQTGTILFIAIAAKPAYQIFELDGPASTKLAHFILGISDNQLVIMFALFVFLIIVGMFMDATAAIYILVPILLPVVKQLGVSPCSSWCSWSSPLSFGLITPPVGVCLYAAENVTGLSLEKVIKSVVPWLFLTVGIICIFILIPQIITGPIALMFPQRLTEDQKPKPPFGVRRRTTGGRFHPIIKVGAGPRPARQFSAGVFPRHLVGEGLALPFSRPAVIRLRRCRGGPMWPPAPPWAVTSVGRAALTGFRPAGDLLCPRRQRRQNAAGVGSDGRPRP